MSGTDVILIRLRKQRESEMAQAREAYRANNDNARPKCWRDKVREFNAPRCGSTPAEQQSTCAAEFERLIAEREEAWAAQWEPVVMGEPLADDLGGLWGKRNG